MSLHKHHLLQVQEQIDFLQECSEAAGLLRPDTEGREAGRRGPRRPHGAGRPGRGWQPAAQPLPAAGSH